jgi:ribosomal protein S27AE
MWKYKSCPRCHGDLIVDVEEHRWYEGCLQCGYRRELPAAPAVREPVPTARRHGSLSTN